MAADEGSVLEARRLLRAARSGTLATAAQGGQPFASLVTPATAPDGSALLLLSSLSEHTRHLHADGRCALMVAGAPEAVNPQTAPRLTVTAVAAPEPDPGLKARWVALHPYAAFYADFGDFSLWRLRPGGGLLVGGFARATRLRSFVLPPEAVAAVAASEASVIAHCNADHADAMATLAGGAGAWRMVAVDVDGCDLAPVDPEASLVRRVAWSEPVASADAVRAELVSLLRAARAG